MNHLVGLMGKSGMAPAVGGTLGSKAFSPTLAVYSDDVIGQALRLSQGFPLSDQELDLDSVIHRGPGGSLLTSDLTLSRFKKAYYESELMPRIGLEEWENRGRPRFESLLRDYTLTLIADQKPADDLEELITKGEAFIRGLP
jgi:trimethylamine:corrinoid methyltransferase-like protein